MWKMLVWYVLCLENDYATGIEYLQSGFLSSHRLRHRGGDETSFHNSARLR
jgi:hypothetical protein